MTRDRPGDADRYIAGQITCHECGHVELLIKSVARPWAKSRRCFECDSKRTSVPVWWPVEDVSAISAAISTEAKREAARMQRRREMN
jgi:hypothetical protein